MFSIIFAVALSFVLLTGAVAYLMSPRTFNIETALLVLLLFIIVYAFVVVLK